MADILQFRKVERSTDAAQMLGVRRVLELAGYIDNRYRSDAAIDRGSRLDAVLKQMDEGCDIGCDAPADLTHQIEQYITFRGECHPVYRNIEKQTQHDVFAVRGRIDREILSMFGYPGILDIKGGAVEKWHRLQLALYWICEGCEPLTRRYSLYLPQSGRYKLIEHRDAGDIHEAVDAIDRARRQLAVMR